MPSWLLPLFPLQAVVFPRTDLPLHIFEERYKKLVGDAIRENSEFGIVLTKDGSIAGIGCTVAVEKVIEQYPDGRMDILTRGRRRFEVHSINEELECLRGQVSYFNDEESEPVPDDVRQFTLAGLEELRRMGAAGGWGEPDTADPQLSFQVAQLLPDLDFRHELLAERSETLRLKKLNHYLTQYIPQRRAIEHAREVAPTNGRGARPAGL